jgi:intracellular septation protein
MMEQQVSLPETAWQQLNWAWVLFFAAMGIVNLYVAFNFSTAAWVNFKLFGFMGLMLVFIIAQSIFLAKHIKTKP